MTELLAVGVGACFAGSYALALAGLRAGPRRTPPVCAGGVRLHVSAVEDVPATPPGGWGETAFLGCDAAELDLTYLYCPRELRVAPHVLLDDGSLPCWRCPEGDA